MDRARIAERAIADLRAATLAPGETLVFWSPVSQKAAGVAPARDGAPRESYLERNVRDALQDGLAVRVLLPRVTAVRFARSFDPAARGARWAVYLPNGALQVLPTAILDSLLRARPQGN